MQKIISVLSIDMDYILEPCINLYNDLCQRDNPKKVWDIINEVRNIDKHLSFNNDNLKSIFDIFTKKLFNIKDNSKVIFANNHDAILYELTKQEYCGGKFNIYNIDHHHDINYNDQQVIDVDRYDLPSMFNWIWYLDKSELLATYYWIKNWNSQYYKGPSLNCSYVDTDNINQTDLYDCDIDIIFVCNSPQWLPRQYDIYFNMLIDIYKNFTNLDVSVIENNFCEGFKEKPYKKLI